MQTITAKQALMPSGWQDNMQIGIGPDGIINYVGPEVSTPDQTLPLLLPAPVNLHSHSFQRAMAGMTESRGNDLSDNFWTWRKLMYRFLDQLNPDHIEAIAALVFMEMLEAGYAGVAEFHYLHHAADGKPYSNIAENCDRIVAAAQLTGIGLTLLPVLYQHGGCDKRPLTGGQRRLHNTLDQFPKLFDQANSAIHSSSSDYNIGIAPHSLRAVDEDGLKFTTTHYRDGPLHMHLAEQVAEVEEVEAHYHARPTQWLLDNFEIDERWCLIHCTQMNDDETRRLAATGAVVGLCPITESNLGDGIFNGTGYLSSQGQIGIGSDSNIHISFFDELKTLEYSQRLRDRTRAALASDQKSTGRVLFEQAVKSGAQAAARNSGAIKVGMFADLIGIETDNQFLGNRQGDIALDSLIFTGHGQSCITDMWSAGRHVVQNGQHPNRDLIIQNFKNTMTELETKL